MTITGQKGGDAESMALSGIGAVETYDEILWQVWQGWAEQRIPVSLSRHADAPLTQWGEFPDEFELDYAESLDWPYKLPEGYDQGIRYQNKLAARFKEFLATIDACLLANLHVFVFIAETCFANYAQNHIKELDDRNVRYSFKEAALIDIPGRLVAIYESKAILPAVTTQVKSDMNPNQRRTYWREVTLPAESPMTLPTKVLVLELPEVDDWTRTVDPKYSAHIFLDTFTMPYIKPLSAEPSGE
jgi:hypothetical protein